MGFLRHKNDKKGDLKNRAPQSVLGSPGPVPFSVDQKYSLAGCSPAEPASAYSDAVNIIPTINFKPKSYPHIWEIR
jgi:hypothetical protein